MRFVHFDQTFVRGGPPAGTPEEVEASQVLDLVLCQFPRVIAKRHPENIVELRYLERCSLMGGVLPDEDL